MDPHVTEIEPLPPEPSLTDQARAEQLARLFHEAYEALAPDHGYKTREESAKPWEDVPEANRNLMVATAARILRDGWKSPEECSKMSREHSRLLDLYFDMAKFCGLQPDDNFEDGPAKARALAGMVKHWETLATDRQLEIFETRRLLAKATGEPIGGHEIPLPGSEVKNRPGWNDLLDFAAGELYDAAKGYELEQDARGFAEKCRNAGQALLEIKVMLDNPMQTIRALARDRDLWQLKCEAQEEKLTLTEYALGETQETVIDLAKGQSRVIELLERFARVATDLEAGKVPVEDNLSKVLKDTAAVLNSGEMRVIEV